MDQTPSLSGFIAFIRYNMGINTTILPDNSPVIPVAYNVSVDLVNDALAQASGEIYTLAVYNLGGSNLINYAPDNPALSPPNNTFFADLRKKWNILDFIPGVIQSSSDESTSQSFVVQEAASNFTLANLQQLKDPWGRQYLAFAQSYGPSIWGLS